MRRRAMQSTDFEMTPVLYQYAGNYQTFTAPGTGWYKIECWGAQGCSGTAVGANCFGGYVAGVIRLSKGENIYVYCGDGGRNSTYSARWNGGGAGNPRNINEEWALIGAGGGATDIRLTPGSWNNASSLMSRVMVAGAGGGGNNTSGRVYPSGISARAGGLTGYDGGAVVNYSTPARRSTGGTQRSGGLGDDVSTGSGVPVAGQNGLFGVGAHASQLSSSIGGGGGSGYYGGGSGGTQGDYVGSGAGGSSYISGHTGCDAINSSGAHTGQPNHYSGKVFKDTLIIDGAGYGWTNAKDSLLLMPKPTGGTYASGAGHTGFGYCKISKSA